MSWGLEETLNGLRCTGLGFRVLNGLVFVFLNGLGFRVLLSSLGFRV